MATKQVKLSLDEVRKNKFFVATPCYGGQLMEPYFRSTVKLMTFFNQHQIPLAFGTIANESLVTRARNVLLAYFLNSDYTHLLFIDADIEFQVEDVLKLYAADKDVVVGAYPKKGVAWQRIKDNISIAASSNEDKQLSDKEIAALGSDYAINFKFVDRETKTVSVENGLIKLHDAGTGFMMIKREALLKLLKAYPEIKYNNDVNINNNELSDKFYALFDTMIDPIDRRYLSEDYTFCRRWQEIGGDIWLDPSISLNHYGHFCFQGNTNAIIQWEQKPTETIEQENLNVKTLDLPDELKL
jgi:hypothetical protein